MPDDDDDDEDNMGDDEKIISLAKSRQCRLVIAFIPFSFVRRASSRD